MTSLLSGVDLTLGKIDKWRLASTLLVLTFLTSILPAHSSSQSAKIIPSMGSVSYAPRVTISVNTERRTATNTLSLGFQLDGRDIRQWRDRIALRTLAEEANFALVRFFEHRLGKPCQYWNETTKSGTWDWSNIDSLVAKIFEIGAEPLIVLGFYSWDSNQLTSAPAGMSNDPVTGLPYPDQWGSYCAAWVEHFKQTGIPVRYYEIINEPFHYFGWYGDQPQLDYYMQLFNSAAVAMRAVNPSVKIGCDESTKKVVLDYFISHGENLDFISFHRYGASTLDATDEEVITAAETKYLYESSNKYSPAQAADIYRSAKGISLPIIMSEGNLNSAYSGGTDPRTRTTLGAVYTALSTRMFILLNFKYCVYFTFGSSAMEGIGMVNVDDNQPWYPYYAQHMIGSNLAVGDVIVNTTSSSDDIRSLAWIHNARLNILLICKTGETRTVSLTGVVGQAEYFKIDNNIPWQSPRIQTGTFDLSVPLTMQGYTVVLLQTNAA